MPYRVGFFFGLFTRNKHKKAKEKYFFHNKLFKQKAKAKEPYLIRLGLKWLS